MNEYPLPKHGKRSTFERLFLQVSVQALRREFERPLGMDRELYSRRKGEWFEVVI